MIIADPFQKGETHKHPKFTISIMDFFVCGGGGGLKEWILVRNCILTLFCISGWSFANYYDLAHCEWGSNHFIKI